MSDNWKIEGGQGIEAADRPWMPLLPEAAMRNLRYCAGAKRRSKIGKMAELEDATAKIWCCKKMQFG